MLANGLESDICQRGAREGRKAAVRRKIVTKSPQNCRKFAPYASLLKVKVLLLEKPAQPHNNSFLFSPSLRRHSCSKVAERALPSSSAIYHFTSLTSCHWMTMRLCCFAKQKSWERCREWHLTRYAFSGPVTSLHCRLWCKTFCKTLKLPLNVFWINSRATER